MSLWKLLTARYGSGADEFAEIRIDRSTNVLSTIEYEHHEVHAGSMFQAEDNAAGGSGTKATISFKTPNTDKWAHAIFTVRTNVTAVVTIGEGCTITGISGTDYAPRNKNRNIATASTLISAGSAGGAGFVTIGAAVTNFGTVLTEKQVGAARKIGGESRGIGEWVLRANTVYAFEVESQEATSEVRMALVWYEHTERNYATPTPTPTPTPT